MRGAATVPGPTATETALWTSATLDSGISASPNTCTSCWRNLSAEERSVRRAETGVR